MSMQIYLAAPLGLLLAACATSGLDPLLLDGHQLHASLATRKLDEVTRHVPRAVLRDNPMLSTDAEFVAAIAHSASQGRLGAEGVCAALYALYFEQRDLGFYGLEAASTAAADRLEVALREIWTFNDRLGRARVHRGGDVLLVVWNDGVSAACWEAVNASVAERLAAP